MCSEKLNKGIALKAMSTVLRIHCSQSYREPPTRVPQTILALSVASSHYLLKVKCRKYKPFLLVKFPFYQVIQPDLGSRKNDNPYKRQTYTSPLLWYFCIAGAWADFLLASQLAQLIFMDTMKGILGALPVTLFL